MAGSRSLKRPDVARSATRARWQQARLATLLIVAGGYLAYANSLGGPFLFDDRGTILDNASIRELDTALGPPPQTAVSGRPITNLSFAINYALGELHVEGYHVWNVTIHILAALTLFGVLRRTLPWAGFPAKPDHVSGDQARTDRLALVCAMAWLLHPLNTEAVNYLTQRTESMVGLFYLSTLYAVIRSWNARPSWRWELAAITANACGMATKESMITAPLMVVLCDRAFAFSSFRDGFAARRRLYLGLAGGWLILLAFARSTPFFAPMGFQIRVSPWTYLLNQAPIIVRYLRLSVWPRELIFDYGVAQPMTLRDVWPAALLLAALLALTVAAFVKVRRLGFWGAWFFITLAPTSSAFPIPTEVGAERRMYLPLVAVIVVIVSAAAMFAPVRRMWLAIATVVLIGLAAGTIERNAEYRSGVSIWQTVLDRRPHARAHANLAVELREVGQVEEAIKHLRIAAPENPEAKHALGSALLERGEVAEAVVQLQEFVRDYPGDRQIATARDELASALYRAGRLPEAVAELKILVTVTPDFARGHQNLANLLLTSEDYAGAAAEYRQVLRLQPDDGFAATHLGLALVAAGKFDEGIAALRRARQLEPRDTTATQALVDSLLRARRFEEAEQEARSIVSSAPNDATAHNVLGVALMSRDHVDEAIQEFEIASRLNPQMREAQENLAHALEERGRGPRTRPR